MRHRVHPKPFGKPAHPTPKIQKKTGVHPAIFYSLVTALLLSNVATLVGFVMAPDIARLLNGQNDVVLTAYEDRVAELRLEVDRLHSRQYAQTGDINLQLQELSQQQEILTEQHQYVKLLADKASELGLDTASLAAPIGDPLITGSIGPAVAADPVGQVAAAATAINSMLTDSRMALVALSDEATDRTDEIVGALAGIGLKPKLPEIDDIDVGGPELPPLDGIDSSSMIDDANAVIAALERFKAAKTAAGLAPVHKPTLSSTRISSTFGNRTDPFTKRKAFHSGIDFAAPWGSTVLAAGYGKVTYVGQMSGYGNVVEITHSNGLITRYGHLSSFLVKEGTVVSTGTPIAKVGSTGRSTGPHLHFEVRRDDNAVDPARYLAVGRKLQTMIG